MQLQYPDDSWMELEEPGALECQPPKPAESVTPTVHTEFEVEAIQCDQPQLADAEEPVAKDRMDFDSAEDAGNSAPNCGTHEPDEDGAAVRTEVIAPKSIEEERAHEAISPTQLPQPDVERCPSPPTPRKTLEPLPTSHAPFHPTKPPKRLEPSTSEAQPLPKKPKNWASTDRPTELKALTVTRPATLKRSRKGERRTWERENYCIQQDQTAKHPESQRPATQSLAHKQADELTDAIGVLYACLKGHSTSAYREALKRAKSSFNDFYPVKDTIKLGVLESKPALMVAVESFANCEKGERWSLEVKSLQRMAQEMIDTWKKRFTNDRLNNH
ncbi:hypothetical protein EUX98_g361 [Antrodiella citrinella]|uniref:Uncharacterized protein n=1 Tax=Antrodiella citrinella TaxID=2447956 RepID=A0A4S4N3Z3_9APHY|nr:hypothetical protein EUX98_g361 [Antrodiella citrinella]